MQGHIGHRLLLFHRLSQRAEHALQMKRLSEVLQSSNASSTHHARRSALARAQALRSRDQKRRSTTSSSHVHIAAPADSHRAE